MGYELPYWVQFPTQEYDTWDQYGKKSHREEGVPWVLSTICYWNYGSEINKTQQQTQMREQ
jgi:hypothetical protein